MIRRPPRSTHCISSAASDVYKRQLSPCIAGKVPRSYSVDLQLGVWVHNQRTLFKNGKMDPERKRMLDEIGFDFNPKDKTNEEKWNSYLKKLQDYFGKHGHCELMSLIHI